MLGRKGMTLMEIIVVLIIIGIAAAVVIPNFSTPMAKSRAQNAVNNLLAIYSAQQNFYNNNNNNYCFSPGAFPNCGSLAAINTALSLNIPDDGSYTYQCDNAFGNVNTCYATPTDPAYSANPITIWFNTPVKYPLSSNVNPYSGACPGSNCPF
jgi:type IV pilus assembly protein PilE